MGEYIQYRGKRVKIGTCESLYYATYPKFISAVHAGQLHKTEGGDYPENYAKPDSGFLFRFPFPDEDHINIGDHRDYNRGVQINIIASEVGMENNSSAPTQTIPIEIVQQKLVHREEDQKLILASVWRNPSTSEHFRIEDDETIKKLIHQINKHHIDNETDPPKKLFYQEIIKRIQKGYHLNIQEDQAKALNIPTTTIALPKEEYILEHLRQQAYNAYRNISFDPEKRAQQTIREYSEELKSDIQSIRKNFPPEKTQEELSTLITNYQKRYEINLTSWLSSKSNTASSMITGPSNFSSDRMRKRNQWADNKYTRFREWRKKALNAITRSLKPHPSELDQARQNLESRMRNQEVMKAANAILRKAGSDMDDKLKQLGLDQPTIEKLKQPDFANRTGYKGFELSNNLAEIRRLRTRVAGLEAKQHLAQTQGNKTEEIDGIRLVHNYETNRIQLHFNGKPAPEVIKELKSRGFHWTPSQMAWQRKLTNEAISAATSIAQNGTKR